MTALLDIQNLSVEIVTTTGRVQPVRDLSFRLLPGRAIGVVGESGSGKTVAMLAVCGLLPNALVRGRALFGGQDLLLMSRQARRRLLGREIGIIFQEPMTALNPVMRVGRQISEAMVVHGRVPPASAHSRAVELLERVGIADPGRRAAALPHELSGGMRQRVGIAMAIACQPRLLIADEPTTALDPTVQAQILELLSDLRRELGMSLVLISHDLEVVAQMTDDVAVLYAGHLVERCRTEALFADPEHPYTIGLLGALPRQGASRERLFNIEGTVPGPSERLLGCRFEPRCRAARLCCSVGEPPLRSMGGDHVVACHRAPLELSRALS